MNEKCVPFIARREWMNKIRFVVREKAVSKQNNAGVMYRKRGAWVHSDLQMYGVRERMFI